MGMNEVISIECEWNTDKNHISGTLCSKFIGCQNPLCNQLQNVKILSTFSGAQIPTWTNFLEFDSFLSEKTRWYRYYQNKTGQKWNFTFLGKQYFTFASDVLFIFLRFLVLQGRCRLTKIRVWFILENSYNGSLKLRKQLDLLKFLSNFDLP